MGRAPARTSSCRAPRGALGDGAGAAAQAGEAFAAALAASSAASPPDSRALREAIDPRRPEGASPPAASPLSLDLLEEIATAIVAHGRAPDATELVDAAAARGQHGLAPIAAALLAARQAAGDRAITDAAIDGALAAEGTTPAMRLRRLERRARIKATLHAADRVALIAEAVALIDAPADDAGLAPTDRARIHFVHASLCEDDPATRDRAEAAYRKGLAFQPGHTGAACRLAVLVLERGDQAGALAEIERALRVDASFGLAWRNAARMLDAQSPSLAAVVGRLLEAANPGAGSAAGGVAPRLVTATAEVARADVLAGVYAHGHRVKNLLGIIGSRTRSARKLATADAPLHDRLRELEGDVTALYEEWATYLRSMQAPTPTIELVAIGPLLDDVVGAARARAPHVTIAIDVAPVPDVRGDRMLLREALLNIVTNAAEACGGTSGPGSGVVRVPGEVAVRARAVPTATTPLGEVVVADGGQASRRANLARLFVPGFTTKETGSGVGLAVAERVVSAHHGRITVDSDEGRGTTITVTLPTDKLGLRVLPSSPPSSASTTRPRSAGSSATCSARAAAPSSASTTARTRSAGSRPTRPTSSCSISISAPAGAAASRSAARSAASRPICRSSS